MVEFCSINCVLLHKVYTSVCDNHAITATNLKKLSLSLWQRILSSHSLLLAFCWGLRGIQLLKNATLPAKVVKIAHAATILNFCLSYNYRMDTSSCRVTVKYIYYASVHY